LVDSEELRNRHLRQAPKRCGNLVEPTLNNLKQESKYRIMEIEQQRKLKAMVQAGKDVSFIIQTLEKYDTEINLDGGTPLNHAINYNRDELVLYLLNRGANVNAAGDGYTPLMSATESMNITLMKLLIEKGADINAQDRYGNTALFKAIDTFDLEVVKVLVEAGADPFQADNLQNYSCYDSASDIEADEIVAYFDTLK